MEHKFAIETTLREVFILPEGAVSFLLRVWDSIQFFDDVADGDDIKRSDLNVTLWDHFIGYAEDVFFQSNINLLKPILATMVLKWQASDHAERMGQASAKSYMWRAGYYDVVLMVVAIIHGHQKATELSQTVMDFYGETFEEYQEEFTNA